MDEFGVKYVGERHDHHLHDVLKEYYDITKNWKGDLYAGISLTWGYDKCTCRLTMDSYISNLIIEFGHPDLKKPQKSPYKQTTI